MRLNLIHNINTIGHSIIFVKVSYSASRNVLKVRLSLFKDTLVVIKMAKKLRQLLYPMFHVSRQYKVTRFWFCSFCLILLSFYGFTHRLFLSCIICYMVKECFIALINIPWRQSKINICWKVSWTDKFYFWLDLREHQWLSKLLFCLFLWLFRLIFFFLPKICLKSDMSYFH